MGRHLHEIVINGRLTSKEAATVDICNSLIHQKERDLDDEIQRKFPIRQFEVSRFLWIEGSRILIEQFNLINNEKMDIIERLENIQVDGVLSNGQLALTFNTDQLEAEGIYRFSSEYLEMLFHMGKFSKFCITNQFEDVLLKTVRSLWRRIPNKNLQYRLIKDKEKEQWFIRGVTSTRYKNYDNHIVLYLTLYALHKHALETHQWYLLDKAYLSDSELVVMFDQVRPNKIIGTGNLYFGVILTNNEIKEKSFSLEYRFRLEDEEGNAFGAIPHGEEPILSFRHDTSIEKIQEKLLSLDSLQVVKDKVLNLVMAISESPYLSENRIFKIFKTIANTQNKFSTETKKSFKQLQEEKVINNSLHIIKALNRLNEIVTDVEERIHLERIFYEVCVELNKGKG